MCPLTDMSRRSAFMGRRSARMCQPLDTGRRSARMCPLIDMGRRSAHVSTHGHGQEKVPEVSKLLRSDDVDDIGGGLERTQSEEPYVVAIADAALASAHVEKHVFMNVIPFLLYFPGRMCGYAMRKRLCRGVPDR